VLDHRGYFSFDSLDAADSSKGLTSRAAITMGSAVAGFSVSGCLVRANEAARAGCLSTVDRKRAKASLSSGGTMTSGMSTSEGLSLTFKVDETKGLLARTGRERTEAEEVVVGAGPSVSRVGLAAVCWTLSLGSMRSLRICMMLRTTIAAARVAPATAQTESQLERLGACSARRTRTDGMRDEGTSELATAHKPASIDVKRASSAASAARHSAHAMR